MLLAQGGDLSHPCKAENILYGDQNINANTIKGLVAQHPNALATLLPPLAIQAHLQ